MVRLRRVAVASGQLRRITLLRFVSILLALIGRRIVLAALCSTLLYLGLHPPDLSTITSRGYTASLCRGTWGRVVCVRGSVARGLPPGRVAARERYAWGVCGLLLLKGRLPNLGFRSPSIFWTIPCGPVQRSRSSTPPVLRRGPPALEDSLTWHFEWRW